jgi:hypothetical protein
VTFDGVNESGAGGLTFPGVENGTHTFTVGAVAGYTTTIGTGVLLVSGRSDTQSIRFEASPSPSPPTFLGLPAEEGYGVLSAVAIAIAVAAGALALARGAGKKPPPPTPGAGRPTPPTPGTPSTYWMAEGRPPVRR